MSPSQQKSDMLDPTLAPLKPNTINEVPFNRLIHNIDCISDLTECVVVDRGVVEIVQRKLLPFTDDNLKRQQVTLHLLDAEKIISVKIWVIPFFSEGVMVYHLLASDDKNLDHLRRLRNPAKPGTYDITSL